VVQFKLELTPSNNASEDCVLPRNPQLAACDFPCKKSSLVGVKQAVVAEPQRAAEGLRVGVFRSRGKGDAMGRAWIGVDIDKDFHWALAIDETGREMLSRRVENEQGEIERLIEQALRLECDLVWGVDMSHGGSGPPRGGRGVVERADRPGQRAAAAAAEEALVARLRRQVAGACQLARLGVGDRLPRIRDLDDGHPVRGMDRAVRPRPAVGVVVVSNVQQHEPVAGLEADRPQVLVDAQRAELGIGGAFDALQVHAAARRVRDQPVHEPEHAIAAGAKSGTRSEEPAIDDDVHAVTVPVGTPRAVSPGAPRRGRAR